jgi:hypothetical protein
MNISRKTEPCFTTRGRRAYGPCGYRGVSIAMLLALLVLAGCSGLTGLSVPGTEKSGIPTTKTYLILENVNTIPDEIRDKGEIYVDDAFFGNTHTPAHYRFVGNDLVVGTMRVEKEKIHIVRIEYPGYESFEITRFFGALPEYSISFRLKRIEADPSAEGGKEASEKAAAKPEEKPQDESEESRWQEFWGWVGGE